LLAFGAQANLIDDSYGGKAMGQTLQLQQGDGTDTLVVKAMGQTLCCGTFETGSRLNCHY
jgi:hypothetical protein